MKRSRRAVSYHRLPDGPHAAAALADQTRATTRFARERGLVIVEPFVEARARGRRRPELERALARCRESSASLLIPELAAVGGDVVFLEQVLTARVALTAVDTPAARRSTLELLRKVALHAQNTTSARSREALRAARARGVRLGSPRPEIGSRAGVAAIRAAADAQAENVAPILAETLLSNPGVSLRDIADLLNEQHVPTPRRGRWGPSAVRNTLVRTGLETLWREDSP